VNEPTRLDFNESYQRSDSEAASTPRSDTDNEWMHGFAWWQDSARRKSKSTFLFSDGLFDEEFCFSPRSCGP